MTSAERDALRKRVKEKRNKISNFREKTGRGFQPFLPKAHLFTLTLANSHLAIIVLRKKQEFGTIHAKPDIIN